MDVEYFLKKLKAKLNLKETSSFEDILEKINSIIEMEDDLK